VGGHCAFHKARFAELGGFDLAFAPFYWEDVDLCLRARNRGWVTAYEANCVVTHDGPSAIRTNFEREKVRAIVWRNRIRFAYRHARGLQRRLLPLGLWLHRVAATVKSDYVLAAAIRNGVESSRQRSD
jgi:GT2 family glycosyltransferase